MSKPYKFNPDEWSMKAVDPSFDPEAWQREVILRNEAKGEGYAPYCMRCPGLVRMKVVEKHYWRCRCGAQCDYRTESKEDAR